MHYVRQRKSAAPSTGEDASSTSVGECNGLRERKQEFLEQVHASEKKAKPGLSDAAVAPKALSTYLSYVLIP